MKTWYERYKTLPEQKPEGGLDWQFEFRDPRGVKPNLWLQHRAARIVCGDKVVKERLPGVALDVVTDVDDPRLVWLWNEVRRMTLVQFGTWPQ